MTKQELMNFLTQLPEEDFSREDLQYRLDLYFKFRQATQQLDSGQFLTMEEVEENLEQWLSE